MKHIFQRINPHLPRARLHLVVPDKPLAEGLIAATGCDGWRAKLLLEGHEQDGQCVCHEHNTLLNPVKLACKAKIEER